MLIGALGTEDLASSNDYYEVVAVLKQFFSKLSETLIPTAYLNEFVTALRNIL
jgi:hypothetical protein